MDFFDHKVTAAAAAAGQNWAYEAIDNSDVSLVDRQTPPNFAYGAQLHALTDAMIQRLMAGDRLDIDVGGEYLVSLIYRPE